MDVLLRQLRHVVRQLARHPTFSVVSVLTLALGIGANAAIFSLVDGILLKPLPYEEPERLVGVWHTAPGLGIELLNQSPATYFTYRDGTEVFEDIGMWDRSSVSITGHEEPERIQGMLVTDGTLPILRANPLLGRTFSSEDDSPGSPETVILGFGYWQRRFGGDAGALGQTLTVDGRPHEIIGVMPQDFRFLRDNPEIYLPLRFDRSKVVMGNFSYQGLARLRQGATIEQANAEVARLLPVAAETYPGHMTREALESSRTGPNVRPLEKDVVGDVGNVLWVLLGTVGLVLLVACANVANLFLVRAEARQQELAVRAALGAGRGRIASQFLLEGLTIGVLGGLVGVGLAYVGLRLFLSMGLELLPREEAIVIDGNVLVFSFVISVLAGFLLGLFPILKHRGASVMSALKQGGRASSDGRNRHRVRNALAVSQLALALVLLVGSGLMIRSFQALQRVEPGFVSPEEVLTLRLPIPESEVGDAEQAVLTHEQIRQRVEQLPGVTSVGLSSSVTMDRWQENDPLYVEEFPTPSGELPRIRRFKWISEEYFETMGNPVLAGRSITWDDIHGRSPVVVVTESLAREYWNDPVQALGKRVRASRNEPWREIVGVVGAVHDDGVARKATPVVYWPLVVDNMWGRGLEARRNLAYAIRSSRVGTQSLLPEVRQAIWSVNPNLPIARVRTLEELLERSMARASFALVMLAIASALALTLGAVGIYGVISYVVSLRQREIGVRMALGAQQADVSRLVLRQGAQLAGAGLLVGLGAALGLTRLMSALLFGVSPADPVTYAAAALALTGVVMLASYVPARRAARVDPIETLRSV